MPLDVYVVKEVILDYSDETYVDGEVRAVEWPNGKGLDVSFYGVPHDLSEGQSDERFELSWEQWDLLKKVVGKLKKVRSCFKD